MKNESVDAIFFKDKVVSFGTLNDTLAMKEIYFQTINSKLFVMGVIPKGATNNDWAVDKQCGIEWESIKEFMIFDSEKEYLEQIELS